LAATAKKSGDVTELQIGVKVSLLGLFFFLSYAYAIWYVSFPPFFIGLDWAKQSGNRLDSTIVWKYCFNQTGDSGYEGGVVVGTDRKL
jgi:hypothetical protein